MRRESTTGEFLANDVSSHGSYAVATIRVFRHNLGHSLKKLTSIEKMTKTYIAVFGDIGTMNGKGKGKSRYTIEISGPSSSVSRAVRALRNDPSRGDDHAESLRPLLPHARLLEWFFRGSFGRRREHDGHGKDVLGDSSGQPGEHDEHDKNVLGDSFGRRREHDDHSKDVIGDS